MGVPENRFQCSLLNSIIKRNIFCKHKKNERREWPLAAPKQTIYKQDFFSSRQPQTIIVNCQSMSCFDAPLAE